MGKPKWWVSMVVVRVVAVDDIAFVAVSAFDPTGFSRDRQPDAGVAKRAVAAIAGDFPSVSGFRLSGGDGH